MQHFESSSKKLDVVVKAFNPSPLEAEFKDHQDDILKFFSEVKWPTKVLQVKTS